MDDLARQTIDRCAAASHDGSAHFPDIVAALLGAGVESYHADYRAQRTTYYLRDGQSHAVALPAPAVAIGESFDAGALQDAIRGAQAGRVMYPEFLRRSRAAGCVGYAAWLAGRNVSYWGRRGETHVERFPGASA